MIPSLYSREELFYPIGINFLNAGGMSALNGFMITTHKHPLNKLQETISGTPVTAILDMAVWYNLSPTGGRIALGIEIEVKRDIHDFYYPQFVGQLLLQAMRELPIPGTIDPNQLIEVCGIVLSGYYFRFATFKCSILYLQSCKSGKKEIIASILPPY